MPLFPSNVTIESGLDLITAGSYLALYTSNPTAADTGTEVTGGSYARKAITFGSTVAQARSNSAMVTFAGLPTATITHYGIRSALTGGTLRAFGTLNASLVTVSGDEANFPVSSISVTLNGS